MKRQYGFGLIEVMLAFIIVAATAGTLLQLNKTYLEYSRDGRSREVAIRLAESKLDELRLFQSRTGFDAIANGSDSVSLDEIAYQREWVVTDYGWNSISSDWNTPPPADVETGKKGVAVTVSWADAGEAQSFSLDSVIAPNTSAIVGPFGTGAAHHGSGKGGPEVAHTPGQFPDVLAIDVGEGLTQETSMPVITVASDPTSIRVSETTTVYDASNAKIQQQELKTVSCRCTLTDSDDAALPTQRVLSGQFSYWQRGAEATKPRGVPKKDQDPLCGLCCENHFDGEADEFSQWHDAIKWKKAEPIGGPHAHYGDAAGGAVKELGEEYLEACRLVRVDGFLRVASDSHLVALNIFPESFLLEHQEEYRAYVQKVALAYMRAQLKDGASFDVDQYELPEELLSFTAKSLPLQLPALSSVELMARGIYVDIVSADYRQALLANMPKGIDTPADELLSTGFLALVPFTERDLSSRVHWSSDNEGIIRVVFGNKLIATIEGETTVRAGIMRSNSGLTINQPISPFERNNEVTASLTVMVSADAP